MRATDWIMLVAAGAAAPVHAQAEPPGTLRCKQTATFGCTDDICIGGSIQSDFVIIFDFKHARFRSAWGGGRIRDVSHRSDGAHEVVLSSPPVGGDVRFSADWRKATTSGSEFTCEPTRR